MHLAEAIDRSINSGIPFVCTRFPGEKLPKSAFRIRKHSFPEEHNLYFVFAPFSSTKEKMLFYELPTLLEGFEIELGDEVFGLSRNKPFSSCNDCWSKDEYLAATDEAIKRMKAGLLEKVVLSRKIEAHLPEQLSWGRVFELLCEQYPNAYVYVLGDEEKVWMGASPETLVSVDHGKGTTMALAGTQLHHGRPETGIKWRPKEIAEQAYVVRYIRQRLQGLGADILSESEPKTSKAGPLAHLKTTFTFTLPPEFNVDELALALHPTPAVCGYPTEQALKQIQLLEPHDRSFYAGYGGFRHSKQTANYFVNLRCMEIFDNTACLFVGGGLTADSIPLEEWDETSAKAQVLLSVFQK